MNPFSLSPEGWVALHLAGVALAATSRVALSRVVRGLVFALLFSVVGGICLLATTAFWTQQAHAAVSCLTLGMVLVAVVFDRRLNDDSELLQAYARGDDR